MSSISCFFIIFISTHHSWYQRLPWQHWLTAVCGMETPPNTAEAYNEKCVLNRNTEKMPTESIHHSLELSICTMHKVFQFDHMIFDAHQHVDSENVILDRQILSSLTRASHRLLLCNGFGFCRAFIMLWKLPNVVKKTIFDCEIVHLVYSRSASDTLQCSVVCWNYLLTARQVISAVTTNHRAQSTDTHSYDENEK